MASEQLEIQIVLDDGSVRQGFAKILNEGKDTGDGLVSAFAPAAKAAAAVAAAFLSIRALSNLFEASIKAAAEQENALNRLNNSLKLAGEFSADASARFQEFAERMQNTTNVEDDQVLTLAALARNYATTNTQALKLTETAINLAAATGTDADSALRKLGGTLSGAAGQLAKLSPELKTLTEEQLKAGAAIDILSARFSGAAAGQINTFSGQVLRLKIQFGELLETIGGKITGSPAVIAALGSIAETIKSVTEQIKTQLGTGDIFKPLLITFATVGQAINTFLVKPIEFLGQIAFAVIRSIQTGFQTIVVLISGIGDVINNVASSAKNLVSGIYAVITGNKELADSINKSGFVAANFSTTEANYKKLVDAAKASYEAINTFGNKLTIGETLSKALADMKAAVEASGVGAAMAAQVQAGTDSIAYNIEDITAKFKALQESLTADLTTASEKLTLELEARNAANELAYQSGVVSLQTYLQTKADIEAAYAQKSLALNSSANAAAASMNKAFQDGLVRSVSGGISAAVMAMAKGQDGFKAFGNAALNIIGDMAIQIGATLIGIGLGIDAIKLSLVTLTGGYAIAAGIALIAVGALLKSLSAGSATQGATSGGVATGGGGGFVPVEPNPEDNINEKDKSKITVNIQGDVLDSRESGLRIVELINDAFDTQGSRVVVQS